MAAPEPLSDRAGAGGSGWRLLPEFLPRAEADGLFERLLERVAWGTEPFRIFGREIPAPRLVAWCGDPGLNYRYAGTDHPCAGWLPELGPPRLRLAETCGFASRLALLNRYRSGMDCMGWHTDDEPGQGGVVATLSLGAVRRFRMRPAAGLPAVAVELGHGSLLLMAAALPHALPRTRRAIGERISVSFRTVTGVPPRAG